MTTETIEKNLVRNEITRKIEETYTDGSYRVRVTTSHNKNHKAYITTVSECQVEKREGYTMEFHSVFTDYFKNIKVQKVSRYSFKGLEEQHNATAEEAAVIVAALLEKNRMRGDEE